MAAMFCRRAAGRGYRPAGRPRGNCGVNGLAPAAGALPPAAGPSVSVTTAIPSVTSLPWISVISPSVRPTRTVTGRTNLPSGTHRVPWVAGRPVSALPEADVSSAFVAGAGPLLATAGGWLAVVVSLRPDRPPPEACRNSAAISSGRGDQRRAAYLLRGLAAGRWKAGETLPGVRQLAEENSVSRRPVHKAVARAAYGGLLEVRERQPTQVAAGAQVRAEQLLAKEARQAKLRRLAIVMPEGINPKSGKSFYSVLTRIIVAEARQRNFQADVLSLPPDRQRDFAERLAHRYHAAVAIGILPDHMVCLHILSERQFPVVVFNRQIPGIDLPVLREDDYGAVCHLGRILLGLGHRNVCMISPHQYESLYGGQSQADAWMSLLTEQGILDECTWPLVYFKDDTLPLVLDRLLHRFGDITALVFAAPALLQCIARDERFHHLRIPGDISIATTGSMMNVVWPDFYPPVTCFELDFARTAQCMLDMICQMLGGNLHPPTVRVPLNLHLTESIGPVPSARQAR